MARLFLVLLIFFYSCSSQKQSSGLSLPSYQEVLLQSANQYKFLMKHLPGNSFPRNFDPAKNLYGWSTSEWWCSGFYPGTLLFLYEETGDSVLLNEAERILRLLEKEQFNTGTHDLGFMMYCSFGNAARIKKTNQYNTILVNSARSLLKRFNPVVGSIRSWNSEEKDFLVIIDNMMNLELLFHATKLTGDSSFYKTAVIHANTSLKNHFRPDNSSYHVLNYDPATGAVKQRKTAQGYSDGSAWARGQAWGLYGFVMSYRETGNVAYLDQARKIARFIIHHPRLPADKIPYWDFDAPGIPGALRDASAAAIMASALLELKNYVQKEESELYHSTAEVILKKLSSPEYRAGAGENGGFILKHGVGHFPDRSEVDVALSYADYYFIEALRRYRDKK